ncbi:MAG: hypothetical protein HZA15_15645 [Nitrospirae bacterium]|nr:hypothetical protein [Nitrospirota bacterium]
MTRFKELQRIEIAIKHKNREELLWGLQYCQMRLKIITMKSHEKTWHKRIKNIEAALREIEESKHLTPGSIRP